MKKSAVVLSLLSASLIYTPSSLAENNDLPDLGASALTVLSIEKEKKLGDIIYSQLQGQSSILQDPLITEYLNGLGNRLVVHAESVKFPFNFFAVNSNDINAFAFYGGNVGVHVGLITAAETESQLASVLSHEIAHVTQRHLARRKEASAQQSNLTVAGLIGSILLAAVNPQAMMATMMATAASSQQSLINYTRANEQEADNIGMNILARANFDPYAAGEFFGKLQAQQRYKTNVLPFLITHPMADSRVTDANLRAQQFEKKFYADSLDFLLMKARVKARYGDLGQHKIERLSDDVETSRGNRHFAAQYALAVAYLDDNKHQKALDIINELIKLSPNNLYLIDVMADSYLGLNKPKAALPILAEAYELRPNNSVATLNYANLLIAAKETKKAITVLEYYIINRPNDYLANQLLQQAYKEDDNTVRYHIASAETSAIRADYRSAIKSINIALNYIDETNKTEINRLEALKVKYRENLKYIEGFKGV
jgi:predicted Zn-dependent protease